MPIAEVRAERERIEREDGRGAAQLFISAFREKIKRAGRGTLEIPHEVKTAMARAAGIDEIKWELEDSRWRLYYSEPVKRAQLRVMLGLRFHRKTTLADQDAEIDEAARRFAWWYANTPG